MLTKDIGICLARRDYSETSQIATIFTRQHGKIRGIAKGARRAKGKFGGTIELLSRGQLLFTPPRSGSLFTLAEWSAQESYLGLRRDLAQLYRAYYLAELMDLFTEEIDPHEHLHDAFDQALTDLANGRGWAEFLGFQVQLLKQVGLSPELWSCVRCSKESHGKKVTFISSSEGGILCQACAQKISEKQKISPAGLDIIRALTTILTPTDQPNHPKTQATPPAPQDKPARQAQELLSYWVRAALNRQPKTAKLLR